MVGSSPLNVINFLSLNSVKKHLGKTPMTSYRLSEILSTAISLASVALVEII